MSTNNIYYLIFIVLSSADWSVITPASYRGSPNLLLVPSFVLSTNPTTPFRIRITMYVSGGPDFTTTSFSIDLREHVRGW